MEMTLRLPSSYVEVERDEMEYLDGGGGSVTLNRSTIQNALICIVGAVSCAMTVYAIGKFIAKYAIPVGRFILGGGAFVQIAAVILAGVIVASAIALATIYLSGGSITLG